MNSQEITVRGMKAAARQVADLFEALSETHCQHAYGQDENGRNISPLAPSAVRWCVVGGLAAATNTDESAARQFLRPIAIRLFNDHPEGVNNRSTGREDAIKLLRAAAR